MQFFFPESGAAFLAIEVCYGSLEFEPGVLPCPILTSVGADTRECLLLTGDRTTLPTRTIGPAFLWALSLLVGVVAGLGAAAFRALIAIFHNLFFLGRLSAAFDANTHRPAGPWGPFVILVPVVGGMAVVFLVKNFAPEAKGHGVPEVIDAVYYHKGFIRPIVSVVKALASALSIGSGGSVGREGPIIQIGSSFPHT